MLSQKHLTCVLYVEGLQHPVGIGMNIDNMYNVCTVSSLALENCPSF